MKNNNKIENEYRGNNNNIVDKGEKEVEKKYFERIGNFRAKNCEGYTFLNKGMSFKSVESILYARLVGHSRDEIVDENGEVYFDDDYFVEKPLFQNFDNPMEYSIGIPFFMHYSNESALIVGNGLYIREKGGLENALIDNKVGLTYEGICAYLGTASDRRIVEDKSVIISEIGRNLKDEILYQNGGEAESEKYFELLCVAGEIFKNAEQNIQDEEDKNADEALQYTNTIKDFESLKGFVMSSNNEDVQEE